MASITYTGSFGGERGNGGITATAYGSALPSDVIITGVEYTLDITADNYDSDYRWRLDNFTVGSDKYGSPSAPGVSPKMQDNSYTFSGSMSFEQGDLSKFADFFLVYADAYTYYDTNSYLWDFTITVSYESPTACSAPTTVTASPASVDAGTNATLSWSGATSGSYNAISAYKVYRATSAGGDYSLLTTVGAGSTSLSVTAPSTMGSSYYYKVAVVDTVDGAETRSSAYATLTAKTYTACTAPTTITVNADNVAPGAKLTLSWSGASAGTNNPITGYEVYRSTAADSGYSRLTTVGSTSTSGSTTVTAPTANGTTYYYKVLTVGTKSGYNSGQSTAYASLTCSFAAVGAPTTLKLSLTNVAPGASATLSWSGASAGDNNAIKGYEVHRATSAGGSYTLLATVTTSSTSGSTTVTAPTTNGTTYYYKVKTLGTLSGSDSALSNTYTSLACTYSAPNAPTTVTVGGQPSRYVTPGTTVSLSWSGASAGANNAITGYDIYRDGVLHVSGLSASTTSQDVAAHSTAGNSYKFTVVTRGAHSNSSQSAACVLYSYTDPVAPTKLTVSDENPVAGARVLLSWSGAAAGGYNDIVGYRIYRSATQNGALAQVSAVDGSEKEGSCYVSAPSTAGAHYYYYVETVGSYSTSGTSSVSAVVVARESSVDDGETVEVFVTPALAREKRGFIFGGYNTSFKGWTLTGWSFPEPDPQENFVEVPGRSGGPLDVSTALTSGDPRYGSRSLTATFECSDGDRLERDALIEEMVNQLHGRRENILFPDDRSRYAVGRLSIKTEYSDVAHAAIAVTATCDPWRYSQDEVRMSLLVVEEESKAVLHNSGRRVLVPDIEVTGYGANVQLTCGSHSWTLGVGKYKLPELKVPNGNTVLTYKGVGTVSISYREAII